MAHKSTITVKSPAVFGEVAALLGESCLLGRKEGRKGWREGEREGRREKKGDIRTFGVKNFLKCNSTFPALKESRKLYLTSFFPFLGPS